VAGATRVLEELRAQAQRYGALAAEDVDRVLAGVHNGESAAAAVPAAHDRGHARSFERLVDLFHKEPRATVGHSDFPRAGGDRAGVANGFQKGDLARPDPRRRIERGNVVPPFLGGLRAPNGENDVAAVRAVRDQAIEGQISRLEDEIPHLDPGGEDVTERQSRGRVRRRIIRRAVVHVVCERHELAELDGSGGVRRIKLTIVHDPFSDIFAL